MSDPTPVTGIAGQVERGGIVHIDLHYIVNGPDNEGDPEPYATLVSWNPPSTPFNLPQIGRAFTKQDSGDWLLVIHVEGLPPGMAGLLLMEIDHAGSEDPIETFPKFDSLIAKWKGITPANGQFQGFQYKVKDPETGDLVKNPFFGVTHFLNDSAIFRVSFLLNAWDPRLLYNICKIDTSLIPSSAAPFLQGVQNQSWLKRSVKGSFRGNVWQIDVEWLLGIWAPDLYSATPSGPVVTDNPPIEDDPD